MWPGNRFRPFPWSAGALILLLIFLAGCAEVKVVDSTPDAVVPGVFVSPLSVGEERHDLAVLAVDFDPPLDYEQLILRRQSVALLVAIENTGTTRERGVIVQAQLTTPEDKDLVFGKHARVESIAPGEIQIVRFEPLGKIPYHERFHLEIAVEPVDGEQVVGNNRRAFDIQIRRK
jgi:hypothetical protein